MKQQYDVFISYSHAFDGQLARRLQAGLQAFAKPWFRRRALVVFRDETNLAVTPALWPTIQNALDESAFFLLLASPGAASSKWVSREVQHWIGLGRTQHFLIGCTEGELVWDDSARDFDWERSTCLPETLAGRFETEPLYVDLRWIRNEQGLSPDDPRMRHAIAMLAARIRSISLDDLIGDDNRQHRRTRRLAVSVTIALALLTALSVLMTLQERERRFEAERQAGIATSRKLAIESDAALRLRPDNPAEAVQLAIEATHASATFEADQALRKGLSTLPIHVGHSKINQPNAFSVSRGGAIAAADSAGNVRVWSAGTLPGSSPAVTLKVGESPTFVALSDTGELVLTATEDWDPVSGNSVHAAIWRVSDGHSLGRFGLLGVIQGVSFSADDRYAAIAIGGRNKPLSGHGLFVWDTKEARLIRKILGISIADMDFSPRDPMLAFSAVEDLTRPPQRVRILHITRPGGDRELAQAGVTALAFDLSGKNLLAGTRMGQIQLRQVSNLQLISQKDHGASVTSVSFGPDGKIFAAGATNGSIRLWEVESGRELAALESTRPVHKIRFGSTPGIIGSLSDDRIATIWNWSTGAELAHVTSPIARSHLEWIPATDILVSAGESGMDFWRPRLGAASLTVSHSTQRRVDELAVDPLQRFIAARTSSSAITVFDFRRGAPIKILPYYRPDVQEQPLAGRLQDTVVFSPDGKYLATPGRHGLCIWSTSDWREFSMPDPSSSATALAFSAAGNSLAVGGADGSVRIYDMATLSERSAFQHNGEITAVTFSSDGASLFVNTSAETVARLSLLDWKVEWTVTGTKGRGLAVSDGGWLLAGAMLLNAQTGESMRWFKRESGAKPIALDRRGRYYAVVDKDRVVVVETATARALLGFGRPGDVVAVAFDPTSSVVSTSDQDGTARMFGLPTGELVTAFSSDVPVTAIRFSPTGRHFLMGDANGGIQVWPMKLEDVLAEGCKAVTAVLQASGRSPPSRCNP